MRYPLASLTLLLAAASASRVSEASDVAAGAASDAPVVAPVSNTPETILPAPPDEAPPPLPHKKGIVLDTSVGALGFMGQFRHIAPTAMWLHTQLGYEVLNWLMLFGEGELFFTDTSVSQDASKVHAFPVFGFGGGARATLHATERVAFFGQVGVGAMKADVPKNTLRLLGYPDAESFNPAFGVRIGVEWYQIDRHMALGLSIGGRDAQGFAKLAARSDTPLMWDGGASIRYTF